MAMRNRLGVRTRRHVAQRGPERIEIIVQRRSSGKFFPKRQARPDLRRRGGAAVIGEGPMRIPPPAFSPLPKK